MHAPEKKGAVIRSPQPGRTLQTRSAPVWDPDLGVFRLWVLGVERSLWRSSDGLNWSPEPEPSLKLDQVLRDGADPDPARRYKAAITNGGFAVSPDGLQWTKLDVPPVRSSDESNFSFDSAEGRFIHSVKRGGTFGRAVAIATSRDFRTWEDLGLVFQSDEQDQALGRERIEARRADATLQQTFYHDPKFYKVDVYNMGVFHYEGLHIGLPALFHSTGPVRNYPNTDGFHVVQLTMSRDLKSWNRLGERGVFIGPSRIDSGAYDLTQILPPSAPVRPPTRPDELWFYYTGLKYRSTFHWEGTYPNGRAIPRAGYSDDVGGVCLAVLRMDGFVSLDAGEPQGVVTTPPLTVKGRTLLLNLKVQEGGEAQVEALDAGGAVLDTSQPLTGDGIRLPVVWKSGADLTRLAGRPTPPQIRLRIRLRQASLYALRTTDQGERAGVR